MIVTEFFGELNWADFFGVFGAVTRATNFVSQLDPQNMSIEEISYFYSQYYELVDVNNRVNIPFFSRAEHINDCSQILRRFHLDLVNSASPIIRAALDNGRFPLSN